MTNRRRPRDAGQAVLDWVAMLAVAALLAAAVVVVLQHSHLERVASTAICRVVSALSGNGSGSCAADALSPQSADPDGGADQPWYCDLFGVGCSSPSQDDPPEQDQPWYCDLFGIGCHDQPTNGEADVPEGMDPSSDLVQTLQSTARGRETLQWLADHDIPVAFTNAQQGAVWDGHEIRIGTGYDNAAVIVHETNHARATANGTSADASRQSKDDYVTTAINEEVEGTVQQIRAAQEFADAGHDVGIQPEQESYEAAYRAARQAGASDTEAQDAGAQAVHDDFFGGRVYTSNTGQAYTDYYAQAWDDAH